MKGCRLLLRCSYVLLFWWVFYRQSFILVWVVSRQTSDFVFAPLISSVVIWYEAKKGLQRKPHLCNLSGPFSKWGQSTHEPKVHLSPSHICIYVVWRKEKYSFCCVERDSKAPFAFMLSLHFKNVIHTGLTHILLLSCKRNIWLSYSFLMPATLYLIAFLKKSSTETLLKVCDSSKGIKHDWIPHCREMKRHSQTLLSDFKLYRAKTSLSCWPLQFPQ